MKLIFIEVHPENEAQEDLHEISVSVEKFIEAEIP